MERSRVLFESRTYVVCITTAGLSVQNKNTNNGVNMQPSHKQFNEYLEAFKNIDDMAEGIMLCRSLMRA